jgi:hypothetical protein
MQINEEDKTNSSKITNNNLIFKLKNIFHKISFIKALQDNLLCLGYLEEALNIFNFSNEESLHVDSSSMFTTTINTLVIGKEKFNANNRNIFVTDNDNLTSYFDSKNKWIKMPQHKDDSVSLKRIHISPSHRFILDKSGSSKEIDLIINEGSFHIF